jgi:hypothetical protein
MDTIEKVEKMEEIKKKRGRKPKNYYSENEIVAVPEKKKRGRKKKYEIENFDKILNRNEVNNFDHNIAYSDDEEFKENKLTEDKFIKKVAFGNLDIMVSKKVEPQIENYKQNVVFKSVINESEWDSDEEIMEKNYNTVKKYLPGNASDFTEKTNEESIKKIRVVTCIKNEHKMESWPETTKINCWWCCHQFDGCPCTLPTKYDNLRKRFEFVGIFCSWNCTKAYNFEKNDHKKYERSELITLLIQQLYGITKAINIKAAPPRQSLKMFGGYLNIEEFRENNENVEAYHLNLVRYNFIYPEITEIANVKIKSTPKNLRLSRNN